ncbi:hypothetical protein [Flagellimonas flava]|uniref:hypothetical protein n=1 Tax=Flagellimonas flava TaxID=570519 RepID=UPI003D645A9D
MSSIQITIDRLPDGPAIRGSIIVVYNDGNMDISLPLELTGTVSVSGTFSLVPYVDGVSLESDLQALEYRGAFYRDYRNVGGTNNLSVTIVGNVVTITSQTGTFPVGQSTYTGDVLGVSFFITNVAVNKTPVLSVTATGVGDCDTVQYEITATGDGSPWRLSNGLNVLNTNWDGSAQQVNLARDEIQHLIQLREPSPSLALLDEVTLIVPRKLKTGEFKIRATQYVGSSDILIEEVNPVNGTAPIEYLLDAQGATSGGAYQTDNVFPGVLPGFYELFVKDKFGCEITKTIQVRELEDASEEENPGFFTVMKGNSIILSECTSFDKDIKPNFNNTLSFNELSGIRYSVVQYWDASDFEPIQFKSSYPFHVVTLHKSDGTKQDLPIVEIANNRGAKEKVDCQLFPINGKTGVYFDGGNEYEPDTTTVLGSSEYTQFLPSWAVEGQIVSIDGKGAFTIEEQGYDSTLERGYFVIPFALTTAESALVQVTWNVQVYNTFECYVPFSNVDRARIVIEKGFNDNGITTIVGDPFVSELQQVKENEDDDLLIQWSSSKNKSDIVFMSGVKFQKRMKGKLRPIFPNNSEIVEGDSRAYTLDQEFFQHYRLELERLTAREVYQLIVASMTDGFKVNGESLKQNGQVEVEPLGESNYFTLKCDYALGANNAAIQPDELVLNASTGVVGGGSTGKPAALPSYDGKTRLNIDGGFVTVGGDFVSV